MRGIQIITISIGISILQLCAQEQSLAGAAMIQETVEDKTDQELKAEKDALVLAWQERGIISNPEIIEAFKKIPREFFTLDQFRNDVYVDQPLPILGGQTISQPTTVVVMLDALDVKPGQKILEIGAGSGYNAAMLGTLVGPRGKVISTEIVSELVPFARENLKKAGISNVKVLHVDGSKGYKKNAPYDRIIATAGAPSVPLVFIDQLKEGGILLIPVDANGYQKMLRLKKEHGGLHIQDLGEYRFVPLTGIYGKK